MLKKDDIKKLSKSPSKHRKKMNQNLPPILIKSRVKTRRTEQLTDANLVPKLDMTNPILANLAASMKSTVSKAIDFEYQKAQR